jgi:hypothetical protein
MQAFCNYFSANVAKDLFGEGVSMQLHWGIRNGAKKRRTGVVNVLNDIIMISINDIVGNGKITIGHKK